jgi:hypothetical protein
MLVQRLGLAPGVREALAFTYERWNGNGFPTGARGDEIPLAMRVVHLTQDMGPDSTCGDVPRRQQVDGSCLTSKRSTPPSAAIRA